MARINRTDVHRPAVFTPGNYEYIMSYSLPTTDGGWPIPSYGINCELDRRVMDEKGNIVRNGEHDADGFCCVVGLIHVAKVTFAQTGGGGKCSVCGAAFIYGDVWRHNPSGEFIHLGHDCTDRYNLLADRSAYQLSIGKIKEACAKECEKARKAEAIKHFLDSHPGLEAALKAPNRFAKEFTVKLGMYESLSEKQVNLALKIASEEPEKTVAAPTGKVTFTGKVVSCKLSEDTGFGSAWKTTIKVTMPDGIWLAWGTAPAAMLDAAKSHGGLKGCEVEVTATLTVRPNGDKHFAAMHHPHGKVLQFAPVATPV